MKNRFFVLLLCIAITFCQGCSTFRYIKEHPYKSLGYTTLGVLIVGAAAAQAYSRSYQSQPTYYYQPPPQPTYYSVPQPSYALQPTQLSKSNYLGKYSSNPYDSQSVSNPYGIYGSQYSSQSINNPYGQYGSPYSSKSVNNPYATDTPKLYSQDGQYLGKVSSNPYDPESISNPYGKYGSKYSLTGVNNPYGQYGSKYSSQSVNNPYTTNAPRIYYGRENE